MAGLRYYRVKETPPREHVQGAAQLAAAFALMLTLRLAVEGLAAQIPIVLALSSIFGLLLLPTLLCDCAPRALAVDDKGITEVRYLGKRRFPWRYLSAVHRRDDGATLCFGTTARLDVPSTINDWAAVVARAEALLANQPPAEDELPVPPELVAEWLALGDQEQLVCTAIGHRWLVWAEPPMVLAGLAAAVWIVSSYWHIVAPVLVVLVLCMAAFGLPAPIAKVLVNALARHCYRAAAERRVDRVLATPDHLDVHSAAGWHRYAWGGLRAVEQSGPFTVVGTADGDLWLPPNLTNAERLLDAIRSAISAESRGLVLPRAGEEVPEAAISLARAEPADDGRGLSQVAH